MKATISTISVPNVSWKKYAVKKGKQLIKVCYERKEAEKLRDELNEVK